MRYQKAKINRTGTTSVLRCLTVCLERQALNVMPQKIYITTVRNSTNQVMSKIINEHSNRWMDKANQLTTRKCPDSPINQMKIKK